ncbi:MAG: hypothetical protein AAF548_00450 [Actinomycetota bacterium]
MPDPLVVESDVPFPGDATLATIADLRARATDYGRRAADARDLAVEIDRRRALILTRDDDAIARHTDDVWSSRAADRSRAELQRTIGMHLWVAADGLRETVVALGERADWLDDESLRLRREADALETTPSPLPFDPALGGWRGFS